MALPQPEKQQFLQVPKEADEDSWISGEELFTDGSSEDEKHKQAKSGAAPKKAKNRPQGAIRKLPQRQGQGRPEEMAVPGPGPALEALETNWRPKRGSLKLPDLFSDGETKSLNSESELNFSMDEPHMPLNIRDYFEDKERLEQIKAVRLNIQELDKKITDTENQLQVERNERLSSNEAEIPLENASFFPFGMELENVVCNFIDETRSNPEENHENASGDSQKFIKRNIELAAKAMNNLPLTDEEKQKLDDILAEEMTDDQERVDEETIEAILQQFKNERETNAYRISDEEKQRIETINNKLQDFCERQDDVIATESGESERLWKDFVLDNALKNVNAKLALLERQKSEEANKYEEEKL